AQLAAVEAPGLVDAHPARTGELELLHALLGVFLHLLRAVAGAAVLRRVALVEAEEDVVLVEAHGEAAAKAAILALARRAALVEEEGDEEYECRERPKFVDEARERREARELPVRPAEEAQEIVEAAVGPEDLREQVPGHQHDD